MSDAKVLREDTVIRYETITEGITIMTDTNDTPEVTANPYGTRAEHLRWAKDRANEYADQGDAGLAIASLSSDLAKHPETESSVRVVTELMMPLMLAGHLRSAGEIRKFIEGFN